MSEDTTGARCVQHRSFQSPRATTQLQAMIIARPNTHAVQLRKKMNGFDVLLWVCCCWGVFFGSLLPRGCRESSRSAGGRLHTHYILSTHQLTHTQTSVVLTAYLCEQPRVLHASHPQVCKQLCGHLVSIHRKVLFNLIAEALQDLVLHQEVAVGLQTHTEERTGVLSVESE